MEKLYADFNCPLCGAKVITEDTGDMHDADYCSDDNCPWFRNQFISYEDMVEIEKDLYTDDEFDESNFIEFGIDF